MTRRAVTGTTYLSHFDRPSRPAPGITPAGHRTWTRGSPLTARRRRPAPGRAQGRRHQLARRPDLARHHPRRRAADQEQPARTALLPGGQPQRAAARRAGKRARTANREDATMGIFSARAQRREATQQAAERDRTSSTASAIGPVPRFRRARQVRARPHRRPARTLRRCHLMGGRHDVGRPLRRPRSDGRPRRARRARSGGAASPPGGAARRRDLPRRPRHGRCVRPGAGQRQRAGRRAQ